VRRDGNLTYCVLVLRNVPMPIAGAIQQRFLNEYEIKQ
jgi:hypothetical protein